MGYHFSYLNNVYLKKKEFSVALCVYSVQRPSMRSVACTNILCNASKRGPAGSEMGDRGKAVGRIRQSFH